MLPVIFRNKNLLLLILIPLLGSILLSFGFHYNYELLIHIGAGLIAIFIVYLLIYVPQKHARNLENKSSGHKLTQFEREEKRLKLEDDIRKTIAQIVGGALLLSGLFLTYNTYRLGTDNYRLSLEQQKISVQKQDLDRRGQMTDRFNKAVTNLGNQDLSVRLGGLYALEQILKDSPEDNQTVIEVLSAYIRDKAKKNIINQSEVNQTNSNVTNQMNSTELLLEQNMPIVIDVQAALTILGRRQVDESRKEGIINLSYLDFTNTNLVGANFANADLQYIKFGNANLSNANLSKANLTNADLNKTNLSGANLSGTNLNNVDLSEANLKGAILIGVNPNILKLSGADLSKVNFTGANLGGADLSKANLTYANFDRANLSGADLRGTNLKEANLSGANLSGAIFNNLQSLNPNQLREAKFDYIIVNKEKLERELVFQKSFRN